jgi:hypothetical protein
MTPPRLRPVAVALAALLIAPAALAEEAKPADPESAWETAPPARRGGFAMGVALGAGVGSIVGFPNDVKKIGYQRYYTVTDVRPSPVLSVWLGGALADWVSFGIGFTGGSLLATGDNAARSGAGMFHIELFPLFYVSERLRDLGVWIDAGAGTATVTTKDDVKLVDGASASMVGGGVFWEPARFWKIRGGPFLMGNYMWSDSMRRPAIFAGWRMSLYTSP